MTSSDLSSIREQLQLLAVQHSAAEQPEEPPIDWTVTRSPSLPLPETLGQGRQPQQTDMVQALRERSPHPSQPTPEEVAAQEGSIPTGINSYLQRLHQEAEKINALSRQQEIAIQKFQRTAKGLDIILFKQGDGQSLKSDQFCELRRAAVTTVTQDNSGRYVLDALSVDLDLDEQQAFSDAEAIRSFEHSRAQPSWQNPLQGLLATPMATLENLWHRALHVLEHRAQLSPLDVLVWGGGGLISRLALDLALSATPALWHWVVGITIAAVALGLYRLLFAPRQDATFIARLFLILVGLGIGGKI